MNYAFGRQPRFSISLRTNSTRDLEWSRLFTVGSYFIKTPSFSSHDKPRFFSFAYHYSRKSPVEYEPHNKRIGFFDLAMAGRRGYYQFGYALRSTIQVNQTQLQHQCYFLSSKLEVWQNSGYEGVWKGNVNKIYGV